MKITRCATAVVEANYDYTYVRIYADNGQYGTGECFFAPGLSAALRDIFPLLIGRDPREVDRIARYLWRKGSGAGAVAGYLYNAVSGIETALWDLVGKSLNVPCWQFLGGKMRDDVRIYVDCHAGDNTESWDTMLEEREPAWLKVALQGRPQHAERYEPEMYYNRAKQMVAAGFDAMKFDIDSIVVLTGEELNRPLTTAEMDQMVACVAAARKGAGDTVDLTVDCHWRFAPTEAIRIAGPGAPKSALVRRSVPARKLPRGRRDPRAGNRPHSDRREPQSPARLLGSDHAPRMRPRGARHPEVRRDARSEANRRAGGNAGNSFRAHNISSPLGTMASAHVCATLPNFVALEFHGSDVPFWNELIARPDVPGPVINKGRIPMTTAPGLGCELNETVARQYAKPGETWFQ